MLFGLSGLFGLNGLIAICLACWSTWGIFDKKALEAAKYLDVIVFQHIIYVIEIPIIYLILTQLYPQDALVTDEAAIPARFWKPQEPKLDKRAVLDALKARETVPGATLSNGGSTVQIRRG